MSKPVISIERISKAFQIYNRPTDMVLEALTGRQRHDLFWALKDVSLEVNEHDRLGIIGPNGSGKSTLLKIITGNLQPSSGRVSVEGKISAMLSLATSLNPEETGISNIKFNLMLNGCPKDRVNFLTEEIIDFTELGTFIYQPVKTYSAGMNAKLAFGIATAIEPEILIIDEVLSVGDAYFVGKAMKRMVELCNRGKALVFVSHSISAVQTLCNKVAWMENGGLRMVGRTDQVLKCYEEDARRAEDELVRAGNIAKRRDQVLANLLSERDLTNALWQLRLIPSPEHRNSAKTYYVRKILASVNGTEFIEVPLGHEAVSIGGLPLRLDLMDSSWGRLYEKDGNTCRVLSPRTGKTSGGRIAFDHPQGNQAKYDIRMKIEYTSDMEDGGLVMETVNLDAVAWNTLPQTLKKRSDGWLELESATIFHAISEERLAESAKRLEDIVCPPIDITSIEVFSEGKPIQSIRERAPFEIHVNVRARRQVRRVDVGINIYRADGVYVFWQSSGLSNAELHDFVGEAKLIFDFSNNYFAMGEYHVGGYCANGWDPINNFPHSEMFVQKVNEARFKVEGEYDIVAFGIVNARVPVEIVYGEPPEIIV